jgi:hypothetical protein
VIQRESVLLIFFLGFTSKKYDQTSKISQVHPKLVVESRNTKKNWEKNFTDFFFSETYIFYAFPFQGVAGLVVNAQRFCNAIVAGDTSTVANIANVQVVVPATKLRLK